MLISRLVEVVRTVVTDIRYGQILTGSVASRFADTGANWTSNTRYNELSEIFSNRVKPGDVLVDVGCGKGRVINYWLSKYKTQKLYGLELDPDIAEAARKRLNRYGNVTILAGDAIANTPADGTLFYLFNPFTEAPMRMFRERLISLFYSKDSERWLTPVRIFYLNPVHENVFREDPRFHVEEINITSSPHRFVLITTKP